MYVTSPTSLADSKSIHASNVLDHEVFAPSTTRHIAAGTILHYEGDEASYIYEILAGTTRSSKVLCDGRRQIVAFGYPGDMIGVSYNSTHHDECEALTDLEVRVYQRNVGSINAVMEPALCEILMKQMATDLNGMQEHFMMLGRKTATEKVASFLVALNRRIVNDADSNGQFKLPMSRADIADFLGLTIETVSRTLSKLRKAGVIELVDAHTVKVLKPSEIQEIAEATD